MYLGTYFVLCCAILAGFATGAQKLSLNSDLTFPDREAAIEGSGNDGEVTSDLESSGSGYGPDDEDTPLNKPIGKKIQVVHSRPEVINYNGLEPETRHHDLSGETVHNQPLPTLPATEGPDVTMDKPETNRPSFFAQPGILAAVIGGAVVGLLCAILVVMFIVYRMRKKDEGSYALGEPKQSPNANSYSRGTNKEFYA